MTTPNVHDAWNAFWQRQNRTGSKGGGCLPDAWTSIDGVRAEAWQRFARRLPRNARVLDLATGNGMVMSRMLAVRRDLKPVGIDRATDLPPAPRSCKVRGGVSMEALPMPDAHFAAVTSQFGFEYGDIPRIAREISRVLHPQGMVALMTHRADGPIVAHNRKRREQIGWALHEQDLIKLAKNSLALRGAGIAMLPQPIIEAPERGAALYGPQSAAWEIAEAVRQTLHLGRQDNPLQVAAILDDIAAQAENELGRISSLELAAEAASDREAVLTALSAAGLELVEEAQLTDGRAPSPFADFRIFRRPN